MLARALAGAVPRAAHARPTARRVGWLWGTGDVVQTMTFVPDAAPALDRVKPLLLRLLFSAGSPDLVRKQIEVAQKKELPLFAWTVNEPVPLARTHRRRCRCCAVGPTRTLRRGPALGLTTARRDARRAHTGGVTMMRPQPQRFPSTTVVAPIPARSPASTPLDDPRAPGRALPSRRPGVVLRRHMW